jgi:hypothetical protein
MTIWPVDHYGGLKVGPIVFRIRWEYCLSERTCHGE